MGTTHAAILHAIPQIISPHAADQRGQARASGEGRAELQQRELHTQLGSAVGAITSTPLVERAVTSLRDSFAALAAAPPI